MQQQMNAKNQETVHSSDWQLTINIETLQYITQLLMLDKSKPTVDYKLIITNRLSIMSKIQSLHT